MDRLHGLCKHGFLTWIVPVLYKAQNHRGFLYVRVDRVPGLYKAQNHRASCTFAWIECMSSKRRGTFMDRVRALYKTWNHTRIGYMFSIRRGTIDGVDSVHEL